MRVSLCSLMFKEFKSDTFATGENQLKTLLAASIEQRQNLLLQQNAFREKVSFIFKEHEKNTSLHFQKVRCDQKNSASRLE